AGFTPNPTYEEVCTGLTGNNEVVLALFDGKRISYDGLLKIFWESHDPTQGMRQGNDVGTQYRSGIYVYTPEQRRQAEASRDAYQRLLSKAGYGTITTEILDAPEFYYAEDYHQQYLAKNPGGYCGLGGTGVACATGLVQERARHELPVRAVDQRLEQRLGDALREAAVHLPGHQDGADAHAAVVDRDEVAHRDPTGLAIGFHHRDVRAERIDEVGRAEE